MSGCIVLEDGTEFRFHFGGRSGKAVLVGFDENDLEKLVRLEPSAIITFGTERMTYADARERLGEIVAYVKDIRGWLAVANYL